MNECPLTLSCHLVPWDIHPGWRCNLWPWGGGWLVGLYDFNPWLWPHGRHHGPSGQSSHLGNCQPARDLFWVTCTSGHICLESKDFSACRPSEGYLKSTASKGPGESRLSRCLLGMGSQETFLGAHPPVLPYSAHQRPAVELLFQEEASGSLLLPSSKSQWL